MCNQFVRAVLPDGQQKTAVLLNEAVPLYHGKQVTSVLAAAHRGWANLRDFGHRGLLLDHFVWDRAGLTKLESESRLWHASRKRPSPPSDMNEEMFAHMDMMVVTPCSLHDAQNAFRWGLLNKFQDRQLMRDIYISVESLRNSADIISSSVSAWVLRMISFAPPRENQWMDEQRALLAALSVDLEIAELVVDQLQLCWEGGRLWVSEDAQVKHFSFFQTIEIRKILDGCGIGGSVSIYTCY